MNPTAPPDEASSSTAPLAGVRVIEVSDSVAAPLCGMTLATLGADVIRIDPIAQGADLHHQPARSENSSISRAGLNTSKRSLAADFRDPRAHSLIRDLILEAGILVTNATDHSWLDYAGLAPSRPDLIHVQVLGRAEGGAAAGRADGGAAADRLVSSATGVPLVTGPACQSGPVDHVLPAWDVSCGLYAALSIVTAVYRREVCGAGSSIVLPLEDVALATSGYLGYLAEAQLDRPAREPIGNAVSGSYGADFATSDGARIMIVAQTSRHFHDLADLTGTTAAITALEGALGVDFSLEGDRYSHREVLTGLLSPWFRGHTADQVETALSETSVRYERCQTFAELASDPRVTRNPLFRALDQPRLGTHLVPSTPMSFDGEHPPARSAPTSGQDTAAILAEHLGLTPDEIQQLATAGTIRITDKEAA